MLGNTEASAALPAVSGFLKSSDPGVKLAAIRAVQQIGEVDALGSLLAVLKSGDEPTVSAVKNALMVMDGDGLPAQVATALRSEERRVGKECVSTCRYRGSQ